MTQILQMNDGKIAIGKQQDCESIIEFNKAQKLDNVFHANKKAHKVATVPNVIMDKWCKEWGCTLHELMSDPTLKQKLYRRLNDPEWRALRTDEGKL